MMKITRLLELSLNYKVKSYLSIKKTGETLKSVDFSSYNLKYNNITTAYDVVVYKNSVKATSGYVVDYINGIIRFSPALTSSDVVQADYYFCPFNIYDEGANEKGDNFKYPAIAIYEYDATAEPFELGNSTTEKTKTFVFEIWSERGGERTDATDMIVEMLEQDIAIIDYNDGFPVNNDGTINNSFDANNILTIAKTDSINYSKSGSLNIGSKPKYLTELYVDFKVFT